MAEEQQVATELQEFGSPERRALIGEYQIGKALKTWAPECLLLLLCLYMIATAIFLWYLAWCEWVWGDPHCL